MNLFRRISTMKLLALVGVVVATVALAGMAFARGSDKKPPERSLASAVSRALDAKHPAGITARIAFTNHLLPSGVPGSAGSALLNGATGRVWVSNDGRFRLELQSAVGDTQIMGSPDGLAVYDASSNTIYRLPARAHHDAAKSEKGMGQKAPMAGIQEALTRLATQANLSGATPTNIAGQPAYSVKVSPRHDGGLLGAVQLAWDANHGVPLKVAVYSRGDSTPVLALTATEIHYGPVASSNLTVPTTSATRTVTVHLPQAAMGHDGKGLKVIGGAAAAGRLPFALHAPKTLVGLPRQSVRLIKHGSDTAALVIYGKGLGAIAVLEQPGSSSDTSLAMLPKISIDGASGNELATALGTVLRFSHGGVTYTVVGSVPSVAAEAAARAIA